MMRPRWRKVLHDLLDSLSRTALVVFSIAVGVFSIGVMVGTYFIISNDMSASYAANNPTNIELRTYPFDDSTVTAVSHLHGVKDAEGRMVFDMRVRPAGASGWTSLNIVAIDDYEHMRINLLTVLEGAGMPGKKEILLERKALGEFNAAPGDLLEFQMPDGRIKTLRVAGIVQDPSTGAGDFLAQPFAYITTSTLAYLGQPDVYNRLLVTVSAGQDDKAAIEQVAALVRDSVEKRDIYVAILRTSLTHEHPMANIVSAMLSILLSLGVLILFLSGSLIANTLSALLNQHMRHIGVMKLVGARRTLVLQMYLALILAFGLIALAIAVPLGGQGAYALSAFIATEINFSLMGYRLIPLAVVIQVLVGLAIPLLAGLVPVLAGSRTTVLRALSGDAGAEQAPGAAEDHPPLLERMEMGFSKTLARRGIHLPRPLLISLRNTFRRKGRLALTLFTLTMGGAIFVAVFNVRLSLHDYIDQIGNYFLADVTLDLERPYRLRQVELAALKVPGVVAVEGWAYANAEALYPDGSAANNAIILAPPLNSKLVTPILQSGRWLQPGDTKAIAVAEGFLDHFPDLQAGDTLRLKINGKQDDWLVVGIFQFVSQQGLVAYAPYETIAPLMHMANKSFSYRIVTDQHDPAYQRLMSDRLDQYFRDLGYDVSQVRTGESTMKVAAEGLDILVTFLLIMALLTALVGSMGLTGTMGMNVMERTREIGVMRSIGAVDKVIMNTVIVEGMVIGGISWFLGALLSFPFTYLLSNVLSTTIFHSPIDVHFTALGFVIWLLVVMLLSAIASVLPARNAARLTIREVLAYE